MTETTKWDVEFKSQIQPVNVPADTLWFHSTGFVKHWRAVTNLDQLISRVSDGREAEICCTTVERAHWVKSQMGVLVKGEVTLLADQDVFSWIGDDGNRYVESSYRRCLFNDYNKFIEEMKTTGGYPEVFVKAQRIVAVIYSDTNFRKWARKYSDLNVPLLNWTEFEAQYPQN